MADKPAAPIYRSQGNALFRTDAGSAIVKRGQDVPYNINGAPAGGTVAWGSVTGTLTDQADLTSALAAKEATVPAGTAAQYWRGDKTWQSLNAAAVSGLGYFATGTDAANLTGTVTAARLPQFTGGDVTTSGAGSVNLAIGTNKVTRAMLVQTTGAALLGATGAGNVTDLTGTQATALLDVFTSALKGLVPASGGGTTNFLRADGTWAVPAGGGGTTTNALTANSTGGAAPGTTFNGSAAVTIDYSSVGAAKTGAITGSGLTFSATDTLAGRSSAGGGAVEEIVCTAAGRALIDDASATAQRATLGLVAVASSGSASDLTAGTLARPVSTPTGSIGYATGAGGSVSQTTSKSTGVTLNTICGKVTMNNAALGAGNAIAFTVTNSQVAATDAVIANIASGAASNLSYYIFVVKVAAGSFDILIVNRTGSTLSEALVINFAVIKSVTA
jgi:hypothetical protein